MYGNVDTFILWLTLITKNLFNECNLKRSNADFCIFYKKDDDGKLELVMSDHIDDVFMVGNPKTLKKIKNMINMKLNIQEIGKVKIFL